MIKHFQKKSISDFPIAKWLHSDGQHIYDPNTCKIRRSTGGASANLTGVFYQCTCGAKKSMAGATRKGALKKIGFQCKSSKPWLGIYGGENCNCDPEDVKVVLRGATNMLCLNHSRKTLYFEDES